MTLSELRARVNPDQLAAPEKVSFHIIFLVTHGVGVHTVDLHTHPLKASSIVSIRPGQVHQWQPNAPYEGLLLIFHPLALNHAINFEDWPTHSHLPADVMNGFLKSCQQLKHDTDAFHLHKLDITFIRQGLIYLLLRIERWSVNQTEKINTTNKTSNVYDLFVRELEKDFRHHRGVQIFSQQLGYSASTLSRACLAAKGLSTKTIIDQRVALEAQRLLAHTHNTIHDIGHQLGFSEPTNFVKFFQRLVGTTPTAFRNKLTPCAQKFDKTNT